MERWFAIWDILFPNAPRPRSPYVEDPQFEVAESLLRPWMAPLARGNSATQDDGGITIPYDIQRTVVERILRGVSDSVEATHQMSESNAGTTESVTRPVTSIDSLHVYKPLSAVRLGTDSPRVGRPF